MSGDSSRSGAELGRALARIPERFRELVERLPAVVYEAEPGPEGAFRYVSPQIEELLGYRPEEWTADPRLWLECLHPDDRDEALRREREHELHARGTDVRMRSEYRMVHRDRRTIWVRDEARLIEAEAQPWVWRGLLIDMTASRITCDRLSAPGGDALRLTCASCGASWVAESESACPECGIDETKAISLNAALAALAASRAEFDTLLESVHQHLDAVGAILDPGSTQDRGRGRGRLH